MPASVSSSHPTELQSDTCTGTSLSAATQTTPAKLNNGQCSAQQVPNGKNACLNESGKYLGCLRCIDTRAIHIAMSLSAECLFSQQHLHAHIKVRLYKMTGTFGDKCAVSTAVSSADMPQLYLTSCSTSCTVAASCAPAASTSPCCCSCWLPVTWCHQRLGLKAEHGCHMQGDLLETWCFW